ncbi:hypothetical protein J1N35_034446 [Gossypium stocksii]|uniref:Reverse transcriptase zinc-binding domain-containing protein n=1 Tax=Gossypium stocksii TaxID=47602 RepID=A0A9D3USC3_9ROSI|nr:hypothetical protein J1N35_034446 [Gossypium stocksii]
MQKLVRYKLLVVVIVCNNGGVYGGDRRSPEEVSGRFKDDPAPTSFIPGATCHKLLTNHERVRRNLVANGGCALCGCGDKTVIHVLRDCSFAEKVWRMVIPSHLLPYIFFNVDLPNYVFAILNGEFDDNDCNALKYAVLCWIRWKNRNYFIFQQTISRPEEIIRTDCFVASIKEFMAKGDVMNERQEEVAKWRSPSHGWVHKYD